MIIYIPFDVEGSTIVFLLSLSNSTTVAQTETEHITGN